MVAKSLNIVPNELVELSKQGDQQAQYQLYQQYAKAMYNICLRMLNNYEEAEDLLQESFAYAFHKINTFRNEATFGAWLKRIVVNHCINHLKKKRIELVLNDDLAHYNTTEEVEQDTEYDVKRVHKAIQLLPDGYRVIFSLYLLEGYDHNEIAKVLGITTSTSKSQFHRAKKKLQDILKTI